jgi:hypothetical protein
MSAELLGVSEATDRDGIGDAEMVVRWRVSVWRELIACHRLKPSCPTQTLTKTACSTSSNISPIPVSLYDLLLPSRYLDFEPLHPDVLSFAFASSSSSSSSSSLLILSHPIPLPHRRLRCLGVHRRWVLPDLGEEGGDNGNDGQAQSRHHSSERPFTAVIEEKESGVDRLFLFFFLSRRCSPYSKERASLYTPAYHHPCHITNS